MPVVLGGISPCKACGQSTPHTSVNPVSRGHLYISCNICKTISHIPTPPPERISP